MARYLSPESHVSCPYCCGDGYFSIYTQLKRDGCGCFSERAHVTRKRCALCDRFGLIRNELATAYRLLTAASDECGVVVAQLRFEMPDLFNQLCFYDFSIDLGQEVSTPC